MLVNGKEINIDDVVANDDMFLKKVNNIYITQQQIDILKKYEINVDEFNDIKELIYVIEDCLNDSYDDVDDLEWVSESLAEYNYYHNTNK